MTVKPSGFDLLQHLLRTSEVRHRVISPNLANVNTPGYKRLDVSFGRLDTTPDIHEAEGVTARADGNTVDIDREIGELNKNALLYQAYAQVLVNRLSTMRTAITGR
jgi:flagellar basal-body rod protein FlgB